MACSETTTNTIDHIHKLLAITLFTLKGDSNQIIAMLENHINPQYQYLYNHFFKKTDGFRFTNRSATSTVIFVDGPSCLFKTTVLNMLKCPHLSFDVRNHDYAEDCDVYREFADKHKEVFLALLYQCLKTMDDIYDLRLFENRNEVPEEQSQAQVVVYNRSPYAMILYEYLSIVDKDVDYALRKIFPESHEQSEWRTLFEPIQKSVYIFMKTDQYNNHVLLLKRRKPDRSAKYNIRYTKNLHKLFSFFEHYIPQTEKLTTHSISVSLDGSLDKQVQTTFFSLSKIIQQYVKP